MQSVILRHLSSSDKDQECDISEAQLETDGGTTGVEVDAGQLGKVGAPSCPPPPCCHHILFLVNKLPLVQVMSTIKGVGNKPLQHANSVTSLPSPAKLPKYNSKHCSFLGIFHSTLTSPGTGWSPPTRRSSACTWTTLPGNAQLVRLPDPLATSGSGNMA